MHILGIIPARYASSRFPAKALADIGGKTMVQRVYEQARQAKSLQQVVVATDHEQIFAHVQSFGGEAVMTSPAHPSGTDRCYEAWQALGSSASYVINIQGDEPFIQPEQINLLAACLDGDTQLATLVKKIEDVETLLDPNKARVLLNARSEAIYFSRQPLPHVRGVPVVEWLAQQHTFYKHIGMYAYRTDVLREITQLPVSSLEKAEALEQLRWIENGYRIKVAVTTLESTGIDTPEDLQKALREMR